MSRILLVDDSPHAQRMGERILSEEGYEVVTVSNSDSALIRLMDVDPDVVIADTVMPGRTGYEICQFLKMSPRHKHVRVILTAGVLEPFDEKETTRVAADGTLKKPFEASVLISVVKPLAEAASKEREALGHSSSATSPGVKAPQVPFVAVVDAEQIRAAVTVALDAAMGSMVDEIAARVVVALQTNKATEESKASEENLPPAPEPQPPAASPTPGAQAASEGVTVRRVNPFRGRSSSFLGLDK